MFHLNLQPLAQGGKVLHCLEFRTLLCLRFCTLLSLKYHRRHLAGGGGAPQAQATWPMSYLGVWVMSPDSIIIGMYPINVCFYQGIYYPTQGLVGTCPRPLPSQPRTRIHGLGYGGEGHCRSQSV